LDISGHILGAMTALDLRLETDRFGPFTFRLGLDPGALALPLARVEDAWKMFSASPLAQVANQLQREVLVQSVFGTNTIEGATLTEEETRRALDADPGKVQAEQEVRVRNIKAAYDLAVRSAETDGWRLDVDYIRAVHAEICRDLPHPDNRPGLFRDNPKERPTVVGDQDHGGIYRPPQYRRDIDRLMDGLVDWHQGLMDAGISPLLRAPLVHLYFELIHPFWDGNGRVGRVLEATLLRQAGYRYAPFALAKFYQEQIHRYFALFNHCRKAAGRDEPFPNQDFVTFTLEGLRVVIERLHGRVNELVTVLLFDAVLRRELETGKINPRQYAIVRHLMDSGRALSPAELRLEPWYQTMYAHLTEKTRQRDLRGLLDTGFLGPGADGRLRPGFVGNRRAG